jgi:hypothetical protein
MVEATTPFVNAADPEFWLSSLARVKWDFN